jgi:hypothetical protein
MRVCRPINSCTESQGTGRRQGSGSAQPLRRAATSQNPEVFSKAAKTPPDFLCRFELKEWLINVDILVKQHFRYSAEISKALAQPAHNPKLCYILIRT